MPEELPSQLPPSTAPTPAAPGRRWPVIATVLGVALGAAGFAAWKRLGGAGPAAQGRTLAVVPAADLGPGESVPDPEADARAKALLAALSAKQAPEARPWEVAVCLPALWKRLKGRDPALAGQGTSSTLVVADVPLEGRVFLKKKNETGALLDNQAFQAMMAGFASGSGRPAGPQERALIYALIPFEIKGRPVSVVEAAGERLFLASEQGMLWLEVISDYGAPDQGAFVVRYGAYRLPDDLAKEADGTSRAPSGRPTLLETTDRFPARLGAAFGFDFLVCGLPPGSPEQWKSLILHPKMTPPDGPTTTSDLSIIPLRASRARYLSGALLYRFDNDYEVLPGTWTLHLVRGDSVLLRKDFYAEPAQR